MAINPIQAPINYMAAMPRVDIGQAFEGLGEALAARKKRQEEEQQKQQLAADLKAFQDNPSQTNAMGLITKYPKLHDMVSGVVKQQGQARVDKEFYQGMEVSMALENGNTEVAGNILNNIVEGRKNAGEPTGIYEQLQTQLKSGNTKGVQAGVNMALAILDPDKYKKVAESTGTKAAEGYEIIPAAKVAEMGLPPGATYQRNTATNKVEVLSGVGEQHEILSPSEVSRLGLSGGATYQRNKATGKITSIGSGGITIKMPPQIGAIPPDYRMIYDANNNPVSMEVIPGSKTDRQLREGEQKAGAAAESTVQQSGIVIDEIGGLKKSIRNQKLSDPVTGVAGELMSRAGPLAARSARVTAEGMVQSIKANIGFDKLNQMRQESPTGGALGNITEQELAFLQSTLGSLDLKQSDEKILSNLDRLYKKEVDPKTGKVKESGVYYNILRKARAYPNAAKYGYAPGPAQPATPAADSVTVGGKTYTRPANFTDAQWQAYKEAMGVK